MRIIYPKKIVDSKPKGYANHQAILEWLKGEFCRDFRIPSHSNQDLYIFLERGFQPKPVMNAWKGSSSFFKLSGNTGTKTIRWLGYRMAHGEHQLLEQKLWTQMLMNPIFGMVEMEKQHLKTSN